MEKVDGYCNILLSPNALTWGIFKRLVTPVIEVMVKHENGVLRFFRGYGVNELSGTNRATFSHCL